MISIREGRAGDQQAIEAVRRASWRAAYAGLIAQRHIERATSSPSVLSHPAPWRRTLVAVAEAAGSPGEGTMPAVVGYAAFGPERTVPAVVPGSSSAGTKPTASLLAAPDATGVHSAGPAEGPPLTEAGRAGQVGEVYAIYTDPAWWSTGTGRSLMAAAVAALQEAGYQRAVLWVLAANARARRFYEIAGWTADGAENVLVGLGSVLEVRYSRPLA